MLASQPPSGPHLGFLTVLNDAAGYLGGYLVTNSWGRPLEFRLSSAVQPTRVQQALYGSTLEPYLHADLIGRALVEKTATPAHLILTDREPILELRGRLEVPVVWVSSPDDADAARRAERGEALRPAELPRRGPLFAHCRFAADGPRLAELLDQIDSGLDLSEPFRRIREAVGEARQMGSASRA